MSASDHYNTPAHILAPIREHFGGIDLDPCSNIASIVNARVEWDIIERGEDGLQQSWRGFRNSFVNCPYSPGNLPLWIEKCYHEYAEHSVRVALLIPVSTSTEWWHRYAYTARWHLYYKGRIAFGDKMIADSVAGSNRHDSVLLCWEDYMQHGVNLEATKNRFATQGKVIYEP